MIWQCNHKFKDKTRCKTPHLTEDEIKAAFVRMVNKLYADREFYVTELTAIKDRLGDTAALEKERYDALVSRYEETERRRDGVVEQINQIMIRRRKLERFIEAVTALPELYTEFDAGQWAGLVESMTVYDKDRIVLKLTCGM